MDIITTQNLTKKFNGTIAVDNISFSVHKGEIFGFLGPNGAGKTTTMKMLSTLLMPTAGNATVASYDILKERDKVRKNIGVVFQEPALDTELTGAENLDFHARMYGLTKETRKTRIDEVLTLVDLHDKKDGLVKTYSGGMKRRLELARGLMHSPVVLFLDEPTLGLDAQTRRAIWDYIRMMNKQQGTTVFLTTHYMEEADYLSDRISIIDHGKILVADTPDNLKSTIGNDVITLTCTDPTTFHQRLTKESWVTHVKNYEDQLTVGAKHGEEKIPLIFDLAQSMQIRIKSISVRKPTLDDVFLYFTGRTIRHDEPQNPMSNFSKMRRR